ncbi:hypothetical protein Tco_0580549 [Tanacetum coccineum]
MRPSASAEESYAAFVLRDRQGPTLAIVSYYSFVDTMEDHGIRGFTSLHVRDLGIASPRSRQRQAADDFGYSSFLAYPGPGVWSTALTHWRGTHDSGS